MIKPILSYCNTMLEGWEQVPDELIYPGPEGRGYTTAFWNKKGLHVLCSVKEFPVDHIHVSIGIMMSMAQGKTEAQLIEEGILDAPEILEDLFGDRQFVKMPNDDRMPSMRHYATYL